jgi:predicted O-linked N-acetylglucosamine transferase (SPINDLY family)
LNDYVVFLPPLDPNRYHAINCLADIFLDSIGWSSNNSTFEALACNLPVVTLPGTLMRQRHCAAILTMMELTETIATTTEEYIEIAVKLGRDKNTRFSISERIRTQKKRIYYDNACITGLENFLEIIVNQFYNES